MIRLNQKGFAPIIMLLAFLAVVLGFIYFYNRSKKVLPIVQPIASPVTLDQITPVDETANWKTYTNKDGGFSFKYPSIDKILENATGSVDGVIVESPNTTTIQSTFAGSQIIIQYENSAKKMSVAEVAKKLDIDPKSVPYKIGGKDGLFFELGPPGVSGNSAFYVYANNKDYTITVSYGSSYSSIEKQVNTILSTFKFTQ